MAVAVRGPKNKVVAVKKTGGGNGGGGGMAPSVPRGRGLHSSTFRLNVSTFCRIPWVESVVTLSRKVDECKPLLPGTLQMTISNGGGGGGGGGRAAPQRAVPMNRPGAFKVQQRGAAQKQQFQAGPFNRSVSWFLFSLPQAV